VVVRIQKSSLAQLIRVEDVIKVEGVDVHPNYLIYIFLNLNLNMFLKTWSNLKAKMTYI
jgi:hypothetical protein